MKIEHTMTSDRISRARTSVVVAIIEEIDTVVKLAASASVMFSTLVWLESGETSKADCSLIDSATREGSRCWYFGGFIAGLCGALNMITAIFMVLLDKFT